MSRRLVQGRQNLQDDRRHREDDRRYRDEEPESAELPPYEAPSCILSDKARTELNKLREQEDDLRKYQKQLDWSKHMIPVAVAQLNDKSKKRKEASERSKAKRIKDGRTDEDRTKEEIEEDTVGGAMAKQGKDLTEQCEKALRDIIDYDNERKVLKDILDKVVEGIEAVPAPEDGEEEAHEDILSAVELLEAAREEYRRRYNSQSMLKRYVPIILHLPTNTNRIH